MATTSSTGRYSIGQKIHAMAFVYDTGRVSTLQPLIYLSTDLPIKIKFIELEVTEHHKVPNQHDAEKVLNSDGYILKNNKGNLYVNQFPHASYGQLDDRGDRWFSIDTRDLTEEKVCALMKNEANEPTAFVSLDEIMPRIKRGIENKEIEEHDKEMHNKLVELHAIIIKGFSEAFPHLVINYVPVVLSDGHVTSLVKVEITEKPPITLTQQKGITMSNNQTTQHVTIKAFKELGQLKLVKENTPEPQDLFKLITGRNFRKLFLEGRDVTYFMDVFHKAEVIKVAVNTFANQKVVADNNGCFTARNADNMEFEFRVQLAENDPRIQTEKMNSIPEGANPFNHDAHSMGTTLVRDIIIMHPGYDNKEDPKPIGWVYIVNTRTGNRVKINIDENF